MFKKASVTVCGCSVQTRSAVRVRDLDKSITELYYKKFTTDLTLVELYSLCISRVMNAKNGQNDQQTEGCSIETSFISMPIIFS